jgi:hypothetical protein
MLIIVPHLFPAAQFLDAATQGLRLRGLETLLARGTLATGPAVGLEASLCQALGVDRQQDWPLAPITLEADGGVAADGYWLRADPVHLHVMRDRIVLANRSALRLSQEEAAALAASVGEHFGAELNPLPRHPLRWYLRLPQAPRLSTTPLSLAAGRDIDRLLPQGPDALRFRVLLNELQMLLHEHPVNQAREARGELAVNSLWLWGGGTRVSPPTKSVALYARDDVAGALAAFCSTTVLPLPPRAEDFALEAEGAVVLDDLTEAGECGDPYGWREAIRRLESDWFAPLCSALHLPGRPGLCLTDPANGKALHLNRADIWKLWRRRRSLAASLA